MSADKERVTLELDGKHGIDADAFVEFFQNAITALREIDRDISRFGSDTIRWQIVEAGFNSPLRATLESAAIIDGREASRDVARTFVRAFAHLNRSNTCPAHINESALKAIKTMVAVAYLREMTPIVSTNGEVVQAERAVTENAAYAIQSEPLRDKYYYEHGSVEGVLTELRSTPVARRNRLCIVDRVTESKIKCSAKNGISDDEIRRAWKRRVIVFGKIRVDKRTLRRDAIEADRLEILPGIEDSIKPGDMPRFEIPGGLSSCDFIESLRND
jgi:uncharacterized protein (UPF0218 family)